MSQYDEMVHAAFGERAKLGRVILPGSFYPVQVNVATFEAAKNTGTPGAALSLFITEGPFGTGEVEETVWLTPGRAGGNGNNVGWVNHVMHVLSGKRPDYSVLEKFGFAPPGGDWTDAEILPPPKDWGVPLPDDRIPPTALGFDPQTGRPRVWPMRLAKAHWATLVSGLPEGQYTLRCRTIDENGNAQPMPRPFAKSGRTAIEEVPIVVQA